MATVPTDAELLEKVRHAPGGTLDRNAADVTINGRRLSARSLTELLALRKNLEWRAAWARGTERRGARLASGREGC